MTDIPSSTTRIKKKLPLPPKTQLQTEEVWVNRSREKIGRALLAFSEETRLNPEILKNYPKIQICSSRLTIIVISFLFIISLVIFFVNSLIWSRHKKIII